MKDFILPFSVSIEILNLLSLTGLLYLGYFFYKSWKCCCDKEQVVLLLLIVVGVWVFSVPMERITGKLGWLIRYFYRKEHGESFWVEMTFFGVRDATYLMLWSYLNTLTGSYLLVRKQTICSKRKVYAIVILSLFSIIFTVSNLYSLPSIDQYRESYMESRETALNTTEISKAPQTSISK